MSQQVTLARPEDAADASSDADRRRWLPRLRPAVVITAVVGTGVGLRLWSMSPLWLDEAQSVAFAKLPLSQLHDALGTDGAPPLYYVALHGWLKLFGDGVWAARSLSMLASVLCIPLAWLVARRLGGSRRLAATTVLLFASNPWAVRYAGEARMYSLVVLEVLLGILATERLRRRPDAAGILAVALLVACLLYTHYWAVFLLANVGAVLAFLAWRRPRERRFVMRAAVAGALGAGAFLPWVPTMLYQSKHTGAPWAERPDMGTLAIMPVEWFGGFGPAGLTATLIVVPMLAVALFGKRVAGGQLVFGARPTGAGAVLGVIVGGTLLTALLAALFSGGAVVARYTAVVVPLMLMLLAHGVNRMPRRPRFGVLGALVGLGLMAGTTVATTPHTQAGRVANALNARAGYGDLIIYCPDQIGPAVEARMNITGVARLELPSQKNPSVIDWTDYTSRLSKFSPRNTATKISSYLKTQYGASVWFVNGSGYRTHREVCGPLRDQLVARFGPPVKVLDSAGRGYERAVLERFVASSTVRAPGR